MKKSIVTFSIITTAMVLSISACSLSFLPKLFEHTTIEPTTRATYQDIKQINIDYILNNRIIVKDEATINKIVTELNKLSTGNWREIKGGKASEAVSINLYKKSTNDVYDKTHMVVSFSLSPSTIFEKAPEYRQLMAKGYSRDINLKQTPALADIWCNANNGYAHDDYFLTLYDCKTH